MSPSKVLPDDHEQLQSSFDFPSEANTVEYARLLDSKDPLKRFRDQYIIPSKANLKTKKLTKVEGESASTIPVHHTSILAPGEITNKNLEETSSENCIYFCGNSLGLQPRPTAKYLEAHLDTWSTIAVNGHFTTLENSPLSQWQLIAEQASEKQAPIVGALPKEVATMGSLTSNLHMLMASFYKPTATRHKIIMDWKAFPSDHVRYPSLYPFNTLQWFIKAHTN